MKKELTFHIDNLAYSFNVEDDLKTNLLKYINVEKNISTSELLLAYIRMAQEHTNLENELENLSSQLPPL